MTATVVGPGGDIDVEVEFPTDLPPHDDIELVYTGTVLTSVVYRQGGPSGTIVATKTLTYVGSNLSHVQTVIA